MIAEWLSKPEVFGEYNVLRQISRTVFEKIVEDPENPFEWKWFFIEKKDETKIGHIQHFCVPHPDGKHLEIGYTVVPSERGKGYCTEAAQIMVDYLFLSKDICRIQATPNVGNKASQRVLEKVGFKVEGTCRKSTFVRGQWQDEYLYSILREEWKKPKILIKSSKRSRKP